MYLERMVLQGFQSFGPVPTVVRFDERLTAFVGANGVGKTAACEAILRMFGVVTEHQRIRVTDFHVPNDEEIMPDMRQLRIEAVFGFPELESDEISSNSVPEFFRHMTADDDGTLRVRIVLDAEWTNDGTLDGSVASRVRVVYSFEDDYGDKWMDFHDRARIQAVYVPATRDGAREVGTFLRGRLWRAGQWSPGFGAHLSDAASELTNKFQQESVVTHVTGVITRRWQELHHLSVETNPKFEPISRELQTLVTNAELLFEPTPGGRRKAASELSDGQRSILHIALTAATLDIENDLAQGEHSEIFDVNPAMLPALTLLILEEPENNLSPFFLSRVVQQLESVAGGSRAQAVISSHAAGVITRVAPDRIRHFRLRRTAKTTCVSAITLPEETSDAGKYVREAVRAYPELYFARLVVLGEGESEAVVLPQLAAAHGLHIDRSFVAVVPLGGRHTSHFWKLLGDLRIPHLTLLDLDWGRVGGGKGRIKYAATQLLAAKVEVFNDAPDDIRTLEQLDGLPSDVASLQPWLTHLERFGVYYSSPLDLDMCLLTHLPAAYREHLAPGERGPITTMDPRDAVLGSEGVRPGYPEWEAAEMTGLLQWYRFLFLTKSKPGRHLLVLPHVASSDLQSISGGIGNLIAALKQEIGE